MRTDPQARDEDSAFPHWDVDHPTNNEDPGAILLIKAIKVV